MFVGNWDESVCFVGKDATKVLERTVKRLGHNVGRFHNLQKAVDVLISRIAAKNVEFKGLTNVWLNVRCRRSIKTKEMRVEVSKS